MYHYVYRLTNKKTNEYYIGSRSCTELPEDDPYMGSMVVWKPNRLDLTKKIIHTCQTRKTADILESQLILKHIHKQLNRNFHAPKSKCKMVLQMCELKKRLYLRNSLHYDLVKKPIKKPKKRKTKKSNIIC